ncbi:MAG: phosphate ABC transporter permease subunit PstC [Nitrospinaceae bacterium]|nr:phosphate ABC transporter permease subunit PstC [Nitrospinaceae bacterium]NIR57491.1 phosphate ABC transporter permease subunit PstC [Nitrospinaceae bacterium]NIS87961.1 phosphate ABC transporter permease subunit PstC [Nitrospinaceae bacterium]NIT84826.1 phosphate ABC transporter permease subunit PstC [Nitrospinaceae bacterium]NIU47006.1 phosphate ABC transporter permease subunit PstC [Nitrospinaceae bacterium]
MLSRFIDHTAHLLLALCVVITILTTLVVIVLLGKESVLFFEQVPIGDFLFGTRWEPLLEPKSFGVLPLVAGTLKIVFGSILLALPLGLLIATYLSEFASNRIRSVIKPVLEILAGIPTVVYGYFALTFVTPVIRTFLPDTQIFNAASAAIVVGIMILPMISSLCDDAFRALPDSLREGAYALGATHFEVAGQVILPAAASRVGAAVILALSRAIGETMAVTLAAGATPNMSLGFLESIQTMTAYIVQVSLGDIPADGIEYLTCYAVGLLLFVMTLLMNIIGNYFITQTRKAHS